MRWSWFLALIMPMLLAASGSDPVTSTWTKLPQTTNGCDELYDYFPGGGLRILYCHAKQTISMSQVVSLAGAPIWSKGPHKKGVLDLDNLRSFGHYNPKFVERLPAIVLPASGDAAVARAAQSTYDQVLRERARLAWVIHEKLAADKACAERERESYRANIAGAADPSYYERWFFFMNQEFCKDHPPEWFFDNGFDGGYDGNVTKTITGWWLRRQMDGTASLWVDVLKKVLQTYDARWLAAEPPPGTTRPL